ncbi:MAG: dipeptide epimerase, partial [Bacteroidota bacterium]
MKVSFEIRYLKKRFPLRISRGVRDGQYNLFVSVTDGNYTGWGETSPGETEGAATAEVAQQQLEDFLQDHSDLNSPFLVY